MPTIYLSKAAYVAIAKRGEDPDEVVTRLVDEYLEKDRPMRIKGESFLTSKDENRGDQVRTDHAPQPGGLKDVVPARTSRIQELPTTRPHTIPFGSSYKTKEKEEE